MHYHTAFTLYLCLVLTPLAGQGLTTQLDFLFEAAYAADKPGASILIARGEEILYERQIGLANLEHGIPVTSASVFSAGSITKQFTAAAILQLEEQGKLSCSDELIKHLQDFSLPEVPITLHQLLTHTSGIPDYPRIKDIRQNIRNNPSVSDLIERVLEEPLDFAPGTDYGYSNTGYLLLGKVIEAASGMSFEEYLKKNIFLPAGLETSAVTDFVAVLPNRTTPYTFDEDRGTLRATSHAYSYAAGGLLSTPRDLWKWKKALVSGSILSPAAYKQMFAAAEPVPGESYYGWEVNKIAGTLSFEHTGFEPGYKASSAYLPTEDLYLIVMQNTEQGSPTPSLLKAAALCLGAAYPAPADEVIPDLATLKRFEGKYVFPGDRERIVKVTEGRLTYQAPGGLPTPLYFLDSLTLFFTDGYRQLHLTPAVAGTPRLLTYQNRNRLQAGTLLTKEVEAEKREIKVSENDLKAYVGNYQTEQFFISISLQEGQLMITPEGSDPLPLTPYARDKFFIPEIGAEIEFKATGNRYDGISLLLEGELYQGARN